MGKEDSCKLEFACPNWKKKQNKKQLLFNYGSLINARIWIKIAKSSDFLEQAKNLDFYMNSLAFKY